MPSITLCLIDIGPIPHQVLDHRLMAILGGDQERRSPIIPGLIDLDPCSTKYCTTA